MAHGWRWIKLAKTCVLSLACREPAGRQVPLGAHHCPVPAPPDYVCAPKPPIMKPQPIRFIRAGAVVTLDAVAPDRTLLEVLREDLACTGTKEGCGEGDCGACTVVLGELQGDRLAYRAVNSCIRLAHSVDGMALWTVEDLAAPEIGRASGRERV